LKVQGGPEILLLKMLLLVNSIFSELPYVREQWTKLPKNSLVWRSAFFVNSALKIQFYVVKNALLQTAFSAIHITNQISFRLNNTQKKGSILRKQILSKEIKKARYPG